jgi:hypothetical protein
MFGQVWVPGAGVAVAVGEALARTCAEGTDVEALAVAVLRLAMPKASPVRPASATPTKSIRIAIRLIVLAWL